MLLDPIRSPTLSASDWVWFEKLPPNHIQLTDLIWPGVTRVINFIQSARVTSFAEIGFTTVRPELGLN